MKPARPNLTFWQLWNLSFGFFGVQIAYSLQSANISRIFATLGADPHSLSFFWILPPLMGMVVQPLVGKFSDRTWCRLGRRIPYLFLGALIAVLVMCMLPNAGSFGLAVGGAMIFGLISLMLLDTSINMAMQPFKMLVGDMVNEEQKAKAYSIQSFLCNAGSLVGYIFPFLFAWIGIANTAPEGQIPDSVKWSFYVGAAILILCVIYTTFKVKEMPPKEYAQFHGIEEHHRVCGSCLSTPLPPSGLWALCSSSAGRLSSICGPTPTEPLPTPYGVRLTLPPRGIRQQATGWAYSSPCRLSVQFCGLW